MTFLRPFWSAVENYTRVTGAGLERKEGSLEGKILFLEQLEGSQPGQQVPDDRRQTDDPRRRSRPRER